MVLSGMGKFVKIALNINQLNRVMTREQIEEKAKRFDEALEKARKRVSTEPQDHTDAILKDIFPELKESEDEKIRKELLESFKYQQRESRTDKEWLNGIKLSEVVAWLEKQGEQKSAWGEEDEIFLYKIQDHIREFYVDKKGYPYVAEPDSPEMKEFNWLESLKDRIQQLK